MKKIKPIFIEKSKVPVLLSFFAPITIYAIALFPFVFCRDIITERVKNHETIHFQQQLEVLIVPFYIIYLYDWIKSKLKGLTGIEAYYAIRAEKEAHTNEGDFEYLEKRKRWQWLFKK